ncbi:hypothetical protein GUITHDRAFT_161695 [Guillardia theta CCMP2712]|uniref:PIH1D1/2/3 CS-like domain-containing protein n=1 Tax=Guillardia theta (strain CCMP2712) TaxID=905079 RepID=L1JQ48_GUITC|nr:hypothetical protein GUITHDRAFT_161695 [Guillardia theta CCMP2712]EKX50711.1 hypothetical protein GUITHDRAFT_161695 [Guillardia theta CCMP2712]|eukprot:XP_005837691.1 hypothetical protein GUITHDRAFT_161695 [Guillardia theta CCMP2712]
MSGKDLELLSNLFSETQVDEEDVQRDRTARLGPGDIGPPKQAPAPKENKKKDPKAIWDDDEVNEDRVLDKISKADKREKPKHDIRYRQQVGTDDVLGAPWSVKDNSTMSCREMIVKVEMPNTKFSTIKLDVTKNEFLVQSPKYLLGLPLPELVNPDKGNAKWDSDKCVLEVILPIVRGENFAHYSMLDDEDCPKLKDYGKSGIGY